MDRPSALGPAAVRIGLLAALCVAEVSLLTLWVDGAALENRPGLAGLIGASGAWILRGIIGFAAAFVAFAGLRGSVELAPLIAQVRNSSVQWPVVGLHLAAAALFTWLTAALYGNWPGITHPNLLAAAWLGAGMATLAAAALALLPIGFWRRLHESTGPVWAYAATVAVLACAVGVVSRSLWQATAALTFRLVGFLLLPLFPNLIMQPDRLRLRAPNFGVIIDQACSGLEGAGLMLVFMLVWLAISRRDFRFPRALLLIPAGVGVLYLLNAVRIAALLVIGNAGAREIAIGGFHSQAGWIAFNGVALGMTLVVPRFNWFRVHPRQAPAGTPVARLADNPTAVYLLPFLAIIAAGMFSRAASANFEWLYGLRLLGAAGLLWMFRRQLRALDWRFGWPALAAGSAVFALWIGLDRLAGTPAVPMPAALATTTALTQVIWIALRAAAAVVTVPIAEELAFRGFLMRRFHSPDFETVPLAKSGWAGMLLSSLAFGLLHGDRWVAGTAAGLAYALVARYAGRIGESAAAHALTNGLLAIYVLGNGQWQYW